jgi:exodeoxyribonuclease VII large subunit
MKKSLSLYELNTLVKETLTTVMPGPYWVEAEISEARERGGHCYLELIEKDEYSNTPIAKASAKIWNNRWTIIRPYFERITGQRIAAGMKVLLLVSPNFHEAYGFSWIVSDIDPSYTLGDMAKRRQEIIRKLQNNGLFELNKELKIPMFAQRIAVISSASAAGYGDFCNQLENNEYGFAFSVKLFPAVMQGEYVESSIISALNGIFADIDNYDVVVIIRGGGAASDLAGFDTYTLAENVAQFPLPIITGIGHERDDTVLDLISHTRVKTPTAAAEFLIDNLTDVYTRINDAQKRIVNLVRQKMQMERMRLGKLSSTVPTLFSLARIRELSHLNFLSTNLTMGIKKKIETERHHLDIMSSSIPMNTARRLATEKHKLELLGQRTIATDPRLLLHRGYSITMHGGKLVRNAQLLQSGDEIETTLEKGTIKSTVK